MSNYEKALKLLKEATKKKKKNDIDGALSDLVKAYEITSKDPNENLGIDAHLRYPKYLILAGKNDEAWSHLSLLLSKGYPGQDIDFLLADYVKIYKAMSLLHKNEKNQILQLIYEHMSFLADIYHCYVHSIENIFFKEKDKLKLQLQKDLKKINLNIKVDDYISLFISFSDKEASTNLEGSAYIAEFNQKANLLIDKLQKK